MSFQIAPERETIAMAPSRLGSIPRRAVWRLPVRASFRLGGTGELGNPSLAEAGGGGDSVIGPALVPQHADSFETHRGQCLELKVQAGERVPDRTNGCGRKIGERSTVLTASAIRCCDSAENCRMSAIAYVSRQSTRTLQAAVFACIRSVVDAAIRIM